MWWVGDVWVVVGWCVDVWLVDGGLVVVSLFDVVLLLASTNTGRRVVVRPDSGAASWGSGVPASPTQLPLQCCSQ